MFPEPWALVDTLAREILKPGGVFVADMWATHLPGKLFLDVAVPRGFEAPFDPLWLSDTEAAFRKVFEGSHFELRVETAGENLAKWEAESEEKREALWKSLTEEQTWVNFGLEKLDQGTLAEMKEAWMKEVQTYVNEEGFLTKEMRQWIAVAVLKE